MKKFILTFILTFTLLILSNIESNGQACSCPTGWFDYSFDYVVPGTSCTITVNFCTNCAPTGHTLIELCNIVVPYSSACEITLNPPFWTQLRNALAVNAIISCDLGTEPCPGRNQTIVSHGACMKLEFDDIAQEVTIEKCDQDPGVCETEIFVCWNNQYIPIPQSTSSTGGECDSETPVIDPSDKFTDCFFACNPF
jgi:hypothetical protein